MIYAKPYDWFTTNPMHNTALLDAFVDHPEFLAYRVSPDDARVLGASLLANPGHIVFGTYDKQELTGVILLTRIQPQVDALLHFFFLDKNLVSKRKLLHNFIALCFEQMKFNRLSMEVPEGVRLERFARKVLNFKLEGELRPRNSELPKSLTDNWVAKQGSRRESSYFDGTSWSDILLLRLLASEWVGSGEGGPECQYQQSSELQHPSSEDSSEKP